ncbi:Lrp/AsnC family transcriptional regulator [Haematospirillum jordaniae]|uniref:AsnC family transcriptional regulator n=1 Tax=Haematospirillum jordaniae TaxID=1549855 RepID=A0A143DE56_9PROT|nr:MULTISPECIES: Lrp/AsnC family transcriptional regulator [Haematospirillum]AMW35005.1 AsnC family transcriptional regulator [Haematospirillum jordaniae]NKD44262.1 Lrp/AsnC family transcriptional regulator [Haematospirillum jordaniae]NKD54063.1 Lrp/AsnC family transcriptional regulator [Haematospirillum sp. H4890]NKD56641.1 Lrp/AsnC family transcriptional regulator [Haematospirillum jordaniae]NKD58699.1 Lrp/AsnC family transcriptional regulator [Haematospirillum jordaniae]
MALDDLDRRLLALLRDNARLPVASLAGILGVSRGTVQNRLDRLQTDGEILGFTVRTRSEVTGPTEGVRAITLIHEQARTSENTLRALREIPEAKTIYTSNGRWDIVMEMQAQSLSELDNALSYIRKLKGVEITETIILLTPHKL